MIRDAVLPGTRACSIPGTADESDDAHVQCAAGQALGFPTRARVSESIYPIDHLVYTDWVTKRLIDVDDAALDAARSQLGTRTIKDTVNEALRRAAQQRTTELANALTVLADADLDDRSAAWR